jgi:Tol biopolymer transport system component
LPQFIYKVDAMTGKRDILVQSGSSALGQAQFSPAGDVLYYVSFDPKSRKACLMGKSLASGQEEEFFDQEGAVNHAWGLKFAISPDGQRLAVATLTVNIPAGKVETRILTVPTKGGEPKELLKLDLAHFQRAGVAWTPDGRSLLFTGPVQDRGGALFSIPAEGGAAREVSRLQTMTYGVLLGTLDLNPDGRRLAFDCFEYRHEVWAMGNFLPASPSSKNE